jgi:hypothetical protein
MDGMEPNVRLILSDDKGTQVDISKKELEESFTLRNIIQQMTEDNPIISIPYCNKALWNNIVRPALKKLSDSSERGEDSQKRINLMANLVKEKLQNNVLDLEM